MVVQVVLVGRIVAMDVIIQVPGLRAMLAQPIAFHLEWLYMHTPEGTVEMEEITVTAGDLVLQVPPAILALIMEELGGIQDVQEVLEAVEAAALLQSLLSTVAWLL
jgi:hypothetical protein